MNPNLYQLADPESHKISNLPHKFIPLLFDPIFEIIEAYHIDQGPMSIDDHMDKSHR